MSFSLGIVGLPNVGKSTLFKALTKKPVNIANYPFCTIDPNVGVVTVPDERLNELARVSKPAKIIPTAIEFYDIAGLVKDAHKGEGLGNKFLSHIREVKAIVHVLRGFSDPDVTHVSGAVNPESDKETINLELIFADQKTLERRIADTEKKARGMDKTAMSQLEVLKKMMAHLEWGKLANELRLTDEELEIFKDLNLLTMKPIIYVLNVDENDIVAPSPSIPLPRGAREANSHTLFPSPLTGEGGRLSAEASAKAGRPGEGVIKISAKIEAELADLSDEEAKAYLKELGLKQSGLDLLIKKSYEILGLITFFTTGSDETHAWTIKLGTKAPEAAGVIHTDFEKGFIKAEVINWKTFVDCGSEAVAKEKGLMRIEGKDYVMQDGDVCNFHFHA